MGMWRYPVLGHSRARRPRHNRPFPAGKGTSSTRATKVATAPGFSRRGTLLATAPGARNRIGIDLRCKMSAGSNKPMKRIAAFLLLVALSPAWATPTKENTRIGENAREARRAAKQ